MFIEQNTETTTNLRATLTIENASLNDPLVTASGSRHHKRQLGIHTFFAILTHEHCFCYSPGNLFIGHIVGRSSLYPLLRKYQNKKKFMRPLSRSQTGCMSSL